MRVQPFFSAALQMQKKQRGRMLCGRRRGWAHFHKTNRSRRSSVLTAGAKHGKPALHITPGEYVPYSSVMQQHKTRRIVRFGFTGERNHETKFQTVDCRAMKNRPCVCLFARNCGTACEPVQHSRPAHGLCRYRGGGRAAGGVVSFEQKRKKCISL